MSIERLRTKEGRAEHLAEGEQLTEAAWLDRCAKRFQDRSRMPADEAHDMAQACLEFRDEAGFMNEPEDAADEEMSCWEA